MRGCTTRGVTILRRVVGASSCREISVARPTQKTEKIAMRAFHIKLVTLAVKLVGSGVKLVELEIRK